MKLIRVLFTLCLCLTFLATASYSEIVDKIVAVVNDEPITQSEVDAHFAPIYQQFVQSYRGRDLNQKLEEARANVLEQLIEDRLVYQEAKRQEIPVTPEEVDKRIEELRGRFATNDEFRQKIQEQGLTVRELRARFEEQIAIVKMHQYQVLSRIMVSPQDIEDYYKENKDQFTEPNRVKARTILIRKNADVEPAEETRTRLEKVIESFQSGESFATLAEKHSQDSNAKNGGDLGFVNEGEMKEDINDALFSTEVGKTTEIIESSIGFHVFLVEAKQESTVTSIEEKREEISDAIFRERADKRLKDWIDELKENAYISIK